jgi:hypothetical protein
LGLPFQQEYGYPGQTEFGGEHQTGRSSPGDDHLVGKILVTHRSSFAVVVAAHRPEPVVKSNGD